MYRFLGIAAILVLGAFTLSVFEQRTVGARAQEDHTTQNRQEIVDKYVKTDNDWSKLSDKQWHEILSEEQYYILREKGTERAFTGKYDGHKEHGVYACGGCGLPLFDSDTKFDSGSGWPSFHSPIKASNISEEEDNSFFMTRTEVLCSRCGGHLGHVFPDGPKPTGLRYCINSAALGFEKE